MSLNVELVAADRVVWSGQASLISGRSSEGELGVMTGHAPVLTVLVPGEVTIHPDSGPSVIAEIDGGFMSVDHDHVLLVVENVIVTQGDETGAAA